MFLFLMLVTFSPKRLIANSAVPLRDGWYLSLYRATFGAMLGAWKIWLCSMYVMPRRVQVFFRFVFDV